MGLGLRLATAFVFAVILVKETQEIGCGKTLESA